MANFERKIDSIQGDIKRNQEIIDQIKASIKDAESVPEKGRVEELQVFKGTHLRLTT